VYSTELMEKVHVYSTKTDTKVLIREEGRCIDVGGYIGYV
jgi:hypothetical protein